MSGLLRWAHRCIVALLATVLVFGISGFEGAVHSVHHPLGPVESHDRDGHHHGHDGEGHGAPAGAPDETCPVAAAALHLAATTTEAPPVLGALSPLARLVTLGTTDGPRQMMRGPARGRAPPALRSLPS